MEKRQKIEHGKTDGTARGREQQNTGTVAIAPEMVTTGFTEKVTFEQNGQQVGDATDKTEHREEGGSSLTSTGPLYLTIGLEDKSQEVIGQA